MGIVYLPFFPATWLKTNKTKQKTIHRICYISQTPLSRSPGRPFSWDWPFVKYAQGNVESNSALANKKCVLNIQESSKMSWCSPGLLVVLCSLPAQPMHQSSQSSVDVGNSPQEFWPLFQRSGQHRPVFPDLPVSVAYIQHWGRVINPLSTHPVSNGWNPCFHQTSCGGPCLYYFSDLCAPQNRRNTVSLYGCWDFVLKQVLGTTMANFDLT